MRKFINALTIIVPIILILILVSDYYHGLSLDRTIFCIALIILLFGGCWACFNGVFEREVIETVNDKHKKTILDILETRGQLKISEFESILEELSKDDYYGEYWADLNHAFGFLKEKGFVTEIDGIVALNEKVVIYKGFLSKRTKVKRKNYSRI